MTNLVKEGFAGDDKSLLRIHSFKEERKGSLDAPRTVVDTPQGVCPGVGALEVSGGIDGGISTRHDRILPKEMDSLRSWLEGDIVFKYTTDTNRRE